MASSQPFSGIYAIIHLVPGGRWYVGQAKDIGLRWAVHRANLRAGNHHCQHLQRAWNKYEERAFGFVVVERCTVSMLDEMEQWWMDETPDLFNTSLIAGHARGFKMSEEAKAKMSAAAKILGANQDERDRRAERARKQHAEGRISYKQRLPTNQRTCKYCTAVFELERHPVTGGWRQNKICSDCRKSYKLYTPPLGKKQ